MSGAKDRYDVDVSGHVSLEDSANGDKVQVVGRVEFHEQDILADPVTAYLRKLEGSKTDNTSAVGEEQSGDGDVGHNMLTVPTVVSAPMSCADYASASGDLNPIHRSVNHAILARIPQKQPIVHGMWTLAKCRKLLEDIVCEGDGRRMRSFEGAFVGMVFPGERLYIQFRMSGVVRGDMKVAMEVVSSGGDTVVSATALVEQAKTVYVFTGQGSAEVGMGMELYNSSPTARNVWDRGDRYFQDNYGFSILDIVRNNPTSMTLHFGGRRGRKIKKNYMALQFEGDNKKKAPVLPEITHKTQTFRFISPEGLLFTTQFSQPALILFACASFAILQEDGVLPRHFAFAGHSLGEYAALSSVVDGMELENVAEISFLRGLIMQKAVTRDERGMSEYGMVAANPMRVGPHFSPAQFFKLVDLIDSTSGKLLQVVNHNVKSIQYVAAGHLLSLEALGLVLNQFKVEKKLLQSEEQWEEQVKLALAASQTKWEQCAVKKKPFVLSRGTATIPLRGIDVPFHSRLLRDGITPFRMLLLQRIPKIHSLVPQLTARYIPNLVGVPFAATREFVELVWKETGSEILAPYLKPGAFEAAHSADVAYDLMIELLAFQFASPVRWIETQDYLFKSGYDRLIEVGASPTLSNMAARTLQVNVEYGVKRRHVLWAERDRAKIYYERPDRGPSARQYWEEISSKQALASPVGPSTSSASLAPAALPAAPAPAAAVAAAVVHAPLPLVGAIPAKEVPPNAGHVIRVMLAHKLKKSVSQVEEGTTIKKEVKGKSALSNEMMGDMEKEFGPAPDGAAEMPLGELGGRLGAKYTKLGASTGAMINSLSSVLPGGFGLSSARTYLHEERLLGPQLADSVLLHATTMMPPGRLGSDTAAREWLDKVASDFSQCTGVALPSSTQASASMQASASFGPLPVVSSPAAAPLPDAPVRASHVLRVIVANRLKKPLSEVPESATLKALAAGRSAIQNELAGDLEKEFGKLPDAATEMPLGELGQVLGGSYTDVGAVSQEMVSTLLSSKMPGGFGAAAVRAYLSNEKMLGPGRSASVLVHACGSPPPARLGSEDEAKSYFNRILQEYCSAEGIALPSAAGGGGSGGGSGGGGGATGVSAQALALINKDVKTMVSSQVDAFNEYLGLDPLAVAQKNAAEVELRHEIEEALAAWAAEHGEEYSRGVRAQFDARKRRMWDSYWSWVMQDALQLNFFSILSVAPRSPWIVLGGHNALTGVDSAKLAHFQGMAPWISNDVEDDALRRPFLCNRSTRELLHMTSYYAKQHDEAGMKDHAQAVLLLCEEVRQSLEQLPRHVEILKPMAPRVYVSGMGKVCYEEIPRRARNSVEYVLEMARGALSLDSLEEVQARLGERRGTMSSHRGMEAMEVEDAITAAISVEGSDEEGRTPASGEQEGDDDDGLGIPMHVRGTRFDQLKASLRNWEERIKSLEHVSPSIEKLHRDVNPFVYIKQQSPLDPQTWQYHEKSTTRYLSCMYDIATAGISFDEKVCHTHYRFLLFFSFFF